MKEGIGGLDKERIECSKDKRRGRCCKRGGEVARGKTEGMRRER